MKRRPMPRSIAKVNAESIDGYFGEGTPCFFIRGTILSDSLVDGDYPTLNFTREGNRVELEAYDGTYAVVTITTRSGNRPGDGIVARLYLYDGDLKVLGIDCERIAEVLGLPYAFRVEELAGGLFGEHAPFVYPHEDVTEEPKPVAEREPYLDDAAQPVRPPEPEPALEPESESESEAHEPVPEAVVAEVAAALPENFDLASFFQALRSGRTPFGRNPLAEFGTTIAAAAVPMLVYLALEFLKRKRGSDADRTDGDEF